MGYRAETESIFVVCVRRRKPSFKMESERLYCKDHGIILKPSLWQPGFEHHGQGVIFILEGAKDSNYQNCGNGLFPEILKSELREVRATIEAYSRKQSIGGYNEASACGLMIGPDGSLNTNPTFRVTTDEGITNYQIDRWE